MTTLTVTAKGQITLKQDLLKHLGVVPGQRLELEKLPDGKVVIKAAASGTLMEFFGSLAKPDHVVLSIDEINRIAADGWAAQS